MGIRDFQSDVSKLNDGIWIELPTLNADGTVPRFNVRGMGDFNPEYSKFAKRKFSKVAKVIQFDNPQTEKIKERITKEIFAEYVLVDWQNFQLDDNGEAFQFSQDNANKIVFDDAWRPLVNYIIGEAAEHENFRVSNLIASAGN